MYDVRILARCNQATTKVVFLTERKEKMLKTLDTVIRIYAVLVIGYVLYAAWVNREEFKKLAKIIRETKGTSLFMEEKDGRD